MLAAGGVHSVRRSARAGVAAQLGNTQAAVRAYYFLKLRSKTLTPTKVGAYYQTTRRLQRNICPQDVCLAVERSTLTGAGNSRVGMEGEPPSKMRLAAEPEVSCACFAGRGAAAVNRDSPAADPAGCAWCQCPAAGQVTLKLPCSAGKCSLTPGRLPLLTSLPLPGQHSSSTTE